jgi:hypothetical protein
MGDGGCTVNVMASIAGVSVEQIQGFPRSETHAPSSYILVEVDSHLPK